MFIQRGVAFLMAMLVAASARAATVTLPDTSQTTLLSGNGSEQATVSVPSTLTFAVVNDAVATTAATAVTVSNIELALPTKQLQISLSANAASFTPPVAGATTWKFSDVSWAAGAWSNATGSAGTLPNGSYRVVATCAAGASGCGTPSLTFTLAPNPAVTIAGHHTLVMTWKFASIGI